MTVRSLVLAGGAVIALAVAPLAPVYGATTDTSANGSKPAVQNTGKTAGETHSAVGRAAASVGNQVEQSLGTKDTLTPAEMKSAMALEKVAMPKDTFSTAKVDDKSGESIGQVHDVLLDAKGNPTALHVDVGGFLGVGQKMVSINAKRFSYLKDRNILVANMTKNQIKALKEIKEPATNEKKSESGKHSG